MADHYDGVYYISGTQLYVKVGRGWYTGTDLKKRWHAANAEVLRRALTTSDITSRSNSAAQQPKRRRVQRPLSAHTPICISHVSRLPIVHD